MEGGLEAKINEGGKSRIYAFFRLFFIFLDGYFPRTFGYLQCARAHSGRQDSF